EIIVYGHTHMPLLELVDKAVTVVNPGAAGPARFRLAATVGIMELEAEIPPRARLVKLCPSGATAGTAGRTSSPGDRSCASSRASCHTARTARPPARTPSARTGTARARPPRCDSPAPWSRMN